MLRKKICALIFTFTFLFSALSGIAFGSEKEYKNNISDDMKTLTSDEFRGRLAGTEENDKAAAYIEERFKEMGIEPYENNSYFQEFPVDVINPDKQETLFTVNFKDGTSKTLKYGEDYVVQIWSKDFDITLPFELNMDDKDAKDKILGVEDSKSISKKDIKLKDVISKKKVFSGSASPINDTYPIIQIKEDTYNYLKNCNVKNVRIKVKCQPEKAIAKNVIGRIKGSNSKNAVVLSAHFDHIGWAGKTIFRGAHDNASGISVLLDAAEQLSKYAKNNKLKTDILICAFNAEELYLVGSKAFVSNIKGKYDNIYNINIDCVGKDNAGNLAIGGDSNENKELIGEFEKCVKKNGVEYEVKNYGTSDFDTFSKMGICAISLGQFDLFNEINGVHTAGDNIEGINFDTLEKVSKTVYDFIISNDEKTFKSNDNVDNEEMEKMMIYDKLMMLQGRENLEYDEYKLIDVDGYTCRITGSTEELKRLEDVKKYYQGVSIPHINGVKFISLLAFDSEGIASIYDKDKKVNEEIGKVYKREINKDNIFSVYTSYKGDTKNIQISIYKQSKPEEYSVLNLYNTEEISAEGKEYSILKKKKNDQIIGFYRKVMLNGKIYQVIVKIDNIDEKNKLTKEEVVDFINRTSIENIVRCFGF